MATVNSGDTITAAQYNDLQSSYKQYFWNRIPKFWIWSNISKCSKPCRKHCDPAAQMDNLRTDINKANTHQQVSGANIGNIAVGQVIGADASGTSVGSLTQTNEGYNDYDTAVTLITQINFY